MTWRPIVIALLATAATAVLAVPAGAQFSGGRRAFDLRRGAELVQFRDFLPFFGGPSGQSNQYNPFGQQQRPQVVESLRAPPPHKVETPPTTTVVVIGDWFADWLGYGLEEAFNDTPEIGIVRRIKPYSGLVRYEAARGDIQDWSQAIKDLLAADKPAAIVVMLGLNDRIALRERAPPAKGVKGQGQGAQSGQHANGSSADGEQQTIAAPEPQHRGPLASYEFHTDQWAELYGQHIDEMIAALKDRGVPVLWVGLPAIRGQRGTSDMSYLDDLYRARAEKAGITYVDIWDGFVDDKGAFAQQGPDFEGQTRRLRTYDGVYFTKPGAEKLAHYVERELRRLITARAMPIALPGPEEQSPGKGNTRPAIGPVLPLSVGGGEGGDLLGAASRPSSANADPVANRVLSHGDAIAAPPGRADDFSWPRANANASDAADTIPPPAEPARSMPAPKGSNKVETIKGEAEKRDTNKTEVRPGNAKPQTAPSAAPSRPGPPRAALDSAAPRPAAAGTSRD
jgi:uncharacterized protein